MASPLRPDPPEHHRPSHAADFARGDSLDRPVGRLPGPHQRWGTRRANPLAGLAPTGGCGWDVALVASGFLCVYLWVMIRVYSRGGACPRPAPLPPPCTPCPQGRPLLLNPPCLFFPPCPRPGRPPPILSGTANPLYDALTATTPDSVPTNTRPSYSVGVAKRDV